MSCYKASEGLSFLKVLAYQLQLLIFADLYLFEIDVSSYYFNVDLSKGAIVNGCKLAGNYNYTA